MLLRVREEVKEMLPNWVIREKTIKELYEGRVNSIKEKRGRKLRVDKLIKACPICKRTYESVNPNKNCGKSIMYYKVGHIPTYGKKKVVCEKCK